MAFNWGQLKATEAQLEAQPKSKGFGFSDLSSESEIRVTPSKPLAQPNAQQEEKQKGFTIDWLSSKPTEVQQSTPSKPLFVFGASKPLKRGRAVSSHSARPLTPQDTDSASESEDATKRPKGSPSITTTDKFRDTCHKATELLFSFLELNQSLEEGENRTVRRKEKVLFSTMTSIGEELARLKSALRKKQGKK